MSNTIHVPDTEEIHRIAYLTMHGWDYRGEYHGWSKDGFERRWLGNPCDATNYDLETAYWAQYEAAP